MSPESFMKILGIKIGDIGIWALPILMVLYYFIQRSIDYFYDGYKFRREAKHQEEIRSKEQFYQKNERTELEARNATLCFGKLRFMYIKVRAIFDYLDSTIKAQASSKNHNNVNLWQEIQDTRLPLNNDDFIKPGEILFLFNTSTPGLFQKVLNFQMLVQILFSAMKNYQDMRNQLTNNMRNSTPTSVTPNTLSKEILGLHKFLMDDLLPLGRNVCNSYLTEAKNTFGDRFPDIEIVESNLRDENTPTPQSESPDSVEKG